MVQQYPSRFSRHAILFFLVIVMFPAVHLRPSGEESIGNDHKEESIADARRQAAPPAIEEDKNVPPAEKQPDPQQQQLLPPQPKEEDKELSQNGDSKVGSLQEKPEVLRQAAPPAIQEEKNVPLPKKQPDSQQLLPPQPKGEDKEPSQNEDSKVGPLQEKPEVPPKAAAPAIEQEKNVPLPEKQPDSQQLLPPQPKEGYKEPSQNGDSKVLPSHELLKVPRQAAPPAIEEDKNVPAPDKQGKEGLQQQEDVEKESLGQQAQQKQRQEEEEQRLEQVEKESLKEQAEQKQHREEAGEKESLDDEAQQPPQQEVIAKLWHFHIETYLLFIGLVLLTLCFWKQCWHLIFRIVGYRDGYQSQGGKAYAYSVLHNNS